MYYDLFPGSIIDLIECVQLIDQLHVFGYQNVGLLFDRGYFSEPNVRELDSHGFEFIMMLCDGQNFVKKLIKAHASMLRDNPDVYISGMEVFGITVEKMLYNKNRYFHIYYDEVKAGYAKRRFLNGLAALKSELLELKGKVLRKNANLTKDVRMKSFQLICPCRQFGIFYEMQKIFSVILGKNGIMRKNRLE